MKLEVVVLKHLKYCTALYKQISCVWCNCVYICIFISRTIEHLHAHPRNEVILEKLFGFVSDVACNFSMYERTLKVRDCKYDVSEKNSEK
jgi:hypothetical protein